MSDRPMVAFSKLREISASRKIAKFPIGASSETLIGHGKTAHPNECAILVAKLSPVVR